MISGESQTKEIDLLNLNTMIDQTNFIVNKKCSGTLIDIKEKLVLTNFHCVGADKLKERIPIEQNRYINSIKIGTYSYLTEVVAHDKNFDLILLKILIDIPNFIKSKIARDDSVLIRGEKVYVVGNPEMLEASLIVGILSNINRILQIPWANNVDLPVLQFSGGLFGGSSGGALYNNEGFLIGIPLAMGRSPINGFAILYNNYMTFNKDGDIIISEKKEENENF
jgi:S1-C subfamily serine protease